MLAADSVSSALVCISRRFLQTTLRIRSVSRRRRALGASSVATSRERSDALMRGRSVPPCQNFDSERTNLRRAARVREVASRASAGSARLWTRMRSARRAPRRARRPLLRIRAAEILPIGQLAPQIRNDAVAQCHQPVQVVVERLVDHPQNVPPPLIGLHRPLHSCCSPGHHARQPRPRLVLVVRSKRRVVVRRHSHEIHQVLGIAAVQVVVAVGVRESSRWPSRCPVA